MSFSFVDHQQKILKEIIRLFESCTRLTKGSQILSLNLIQLFGVTHKQPDRRVRRIFLDAFDVDWSLNLCLLERSKIAIHAPLRAGVALCFDLAIERNPLVCSLFPAL